MVACDSFSAFKNASQDSSMQFGSDNVRFQLGELPDSSGISIPVESLVKTDRTNPREDQKIKPMVGKAEEFVANSRFLTLMFTSLRTT